MKFGRGGFAGIEVAFFMVAIFSVGFFCLVSLLREGNEALKNVDGTRIKYEGKVLWKTR